jgi:uncharacterized membrane-anchored protein
MSNGKRTAVRAVVAAILAGSMAMAFTAEPSPDEAGKKINALGWQQGPTSTSLSGKASLKVPDGNAILNENDSSKFLELTGNLPGPGINIVASKSWWATFEFDPVGYVKDDEKIDADALIKQMKDSDGPANEERRKHGLPELYTEGWYIPPHYDPATKYLEWGLRLRSAGDPTPVINYTVRMLGRSGYERVVLVSSPEQLDADVKSFKATLKGFDFNSGEKYAEFKQGDRIAEYGLAALVAGGAAAVAAKTGLWKVVLGFLAASWKLVAGVVVALGAGLSKLFSRKKA